MEFNDYWKSIQSDLEVWKAEMQKEPGLASKISKSVQVKINNVIPEKVHLLITTTIKQMIRAMIFGSVYTTRKKYTKYVLKDQDKLARRTIEVYSTTAAAEGAATGAGGFLLGVADFPLWLSLKMKMLHEIANIYNFDIRDYRERVFMLYIFQITFSSQVQRNKTFPIMEEWEYQKKALPEDINDFDWKTFQIEYRDYLDIAKLFQMIPGIGAVVGGLVNHRLTRKLGHNAIQAYHMRLTMGS